MRRNKIIINVLLFLSVILWGFFYYIYNNIVREYRLDAFIEDKKIDLDLINYSYISLYGIIIIILIVVIINNQNIK